MERDAILELLHRTGALTDAHDQAPDGRHIGARLRLPRVLQYAPFNRRLSHEIVRHFLELDIHVVIALDAESVPCSVEIGRQLEARALWVNNSSEGVRLAPGFALHHGERVLLVTAVLSSNDQIGAAATLVRQATARLIGIGSIVDTRGSTRVETARDTAAIKLELPVWEPGECPRCAAGLPLGWVESHEEMVEKRLGGDA